MFRDYICVEDFRDDVSTMTVAFSFLPARPRSIWVSEIASKRVRDQSSMSPRLEMDPLNTERKGMARVSAPQLKRRTKI